MTKNILVADNSITIQKILAMAFENEDAIVEGVSKGKDALDKMETFKPDIVLADVDMQDLTGIELSKTIKNNPNFNSTKVLLLASDFEDFNKDLFENSGADDHISKPFKSEDIIKKVIDLLSEKSHQSTDETINLTSIDLDESNKSPGPTIELSSEDIVEKDSPINLSPDDLEEPVNTTESTIELSSEDIVEKDSAINLSPDDLEESVNTTPVDEVKLEAKTTKDIAENPLNEMIEDVESFKKAVVTQDADYDELSEEVAPTQEDAVGDELDMAFRQISNFGSWEEADNITAMELDPKSTLSTIENITPEPEDLLEEITFSVEEGEKRLSESNLTDENLSRLSRTSQGLNSQQPAIAQKNQNMIGQVRHTLEDVIQASVEKELAELSKSITESVREIVKEITPKIVKEIVKEEIGKIKSSKKV